MEFSIDESPAARVLGPLFKLTEVHLWDDGSSEVRKISHSHELVNIPNVDADYEKGGSEKTNGLSLLHGDAELVKELSDFGLPLSFHTNKERRNGMVRGKRKGTRKINLQMPLENDSSWTEEPDIQLKTSQMMDKYENLNHGIVIDVDRLSNLSLDRVDSMSSTACTSALEASSIISDLGSQHSLGRSSRSGKCRMGEAEAFQNTSEIVDTGLRIDGGSCLTNEIAACDERDINGEIQSAMDHDAEGQSNDISFEVMQGEDGRAYPLFEHPNWPEDGWTAYWDDFHVRTYFYNVRTEESTWDPPPGKGHLVRGDLAGDHTKTVIELTDLNNDLLDSKKSDEVYRSEERINHNGSTIQEFDEIPDNIIYTSSTKRKKKVKRAKSKEEVSISCEDLEGVLLEVTPCISKYWCQRYILFSRFDHGIKMDEEGWFSVTPELLSKHHAVRCGTGAIVDFFTGVGGNAIQFAQWSKHVIAIDIDPRKIEYARHNAGIYGVAENIDFIKGDSFSLAPRLKANTVFMSPPWGGPNYSKVKKFDINNMLRPRDGQFLFNVGMGIASRIVMFLPRNVDVNQLAELSLSATPPWSLEVERNYLNGRLKAVTAYFCEPSKSASQITVQPHLHSDL